jgi:hypothetical protein
VIVIALKHASLVNLLLPQFCYLILDWLYNGPVVLVMIVGMYQVGAREFETVLAGVD